MIPKEKQAEFEDLLREALKGDQPPLKEFVEAVMTNRVTLPGDIMGQLVDRGWLPRQRCEVWSRVMGYYRPVSQWNVGKKAEYADRVQLDPRDIDYEE